MPLRVVSGISSGFPGLSQSLGQVTHVLLTRSPLIAREQALEVTVRLACVKHAASVRPEPGSNSPLMFSSAGRDRRKTRPVEGLYHWLSKNNLRYSLSTKGFSFEVSLTGPVGHGS